MKTPRKSDVSSRDRFTWNDADVQFLDEKGKVMTPEQVREVQDRAAGGTSSGELFSDEVHHLADGENE